MEETFFALLAAAVSGLSVVFVRKKSDESSVLTISMILCLIGNIIIWPLAIVFTDLRTANPESIAIFAVAGLLNPGIARLLYYRGMQIVGVSVNASISGTYPMYTSMLAVLLLAEAFSLANWLGVVLILVGVIFIQSPSMNATGQKKLSLKSLSFSILTSLVVAISHIMRKTGLNICNEPLLGVAIGYTISLPLYSLLLISSETWRRSLFLKRDFRFFWKAGVGFSLAWLLSFYALSCGRVSVVATLFQVEPLFVVFFAYLYLRELEHISYKLILSIGLIVFGAALVVL